MINFLKVFTGSAILVGGVFTVVTVLTVAAVFLMPKGKSPAPLSDNYLTVSYFQTDTKNPSKSNVTKEKSLYCNGSDCQDLVNDLQSSCSVKEDNPRIIVEGYFNNEHINQTITPNCSSFEAVSNVLA